MPFLSSIQALLTSFAAVVPLEWFVLIGSFVEEIIAPIPAPVVMTTAGSLAFLSGHGWLWLFGLAVIGSFGKTAGGWVLYYLADKGENFLLGRFGKYFMITHEEVERLGSYFSGSWRDTLILTVLRAIPVVPSLALSLGSGLIKLRLRTYLIGTFVGLIFRGFFFLYIGYLGVKSYENLGSRIADVENYAQIGFVLLSIVVLGLLYWQQKTGGVSRWLNIFLKKK